MIDGVRRSIAVAWVVGVAAQCALADGVIGGGPLPSGPCTSDADVQRIAAAVATFEAAHGPLSQGGIASVAPYAFFPIGATLNDDTFISNFVDLQIGPGLLDYECSANVVPEHNGWDAGIRSFVEQAIGVPVFAILDGVVVHTHDGEPDMNTQALGQLGNEVLIDHGNGRLGWYVHLKRDSVAVAIGEPVRAGRQIGMVGSSGNSAGPHLHFASLQALIGVEPFAGSCRAGPSGWVAQPPMHRALRLADFATTYQSPMVNGGLPFDPTRCGQIGLDDSTLYYWLIVENLPADSYWRVRLQRPDGLIGLDTGDVLFGHSYLRLAWFPFALSVANFENTVGTWKILLDFNGVRMIDAPIEVVPSRVPGFNRPPAPIAAAIDPAAPTAADAIFCRVNTSLTLDDPDFDVVRYEYVWRVNGQEVRRVTSAGHADAIPARAARGGDVVECTVTAGDGNGGFAQPVTVQATPTGGGSVGGDANCDGAVNFFDIDPFVLALFDPVGYVAAFPGCSLDNADVNGDGLTNFFDIDPFVACLFGEC